MENRNSSLLLSLIPRGPFLVYDLSPYRKFDLNGTRPECDDSQNSLVLFLLLVLQLELAYQQPTVS